MQTIKKIITTIKNMRWKKKLFYFSTSLLLIFLITVVVSPFNKIREFQNLVYADSVFIEKFDSIYYHPEMSNLLKEKVYKEALLKLAESDSIQMLVNLSDSTVSLSIKGVMINQTKVSEFNKDKLLGKIPLMQEVKLFSQPLSVYSQYATIVKEPVVVRHAPKDTLEAALNAWQPDTLIQNPAFVAFTIEYGIQLIFEQDNNQNFHNKWKRFCFYNHLRFQKTITSISNFACLKKQEYLSTIIIKLPVNDLRAIYRALPENTYIVLKL